MAQNFVQPGKTITLASETYPGKSSGDPIVVGRVPVVALTDNPAVTGQTFEGATEGVFTLPKLAEGITQGQPVYLTTGSLTASVTGNIAFGVAWETAATGDTTIDVKIPSPNLRYTPTGVV